MFHMIKLLHALPLVLFLFPCGCVVNRLMTAEERQAYLQYRNEVDRLNFEREKAGLPREKPLTYEEWRKQ